MAHSVGTLCGADEPACGLSLAGNPVPDAGDVGAAVGALALLELHLGDAEVNAADHRLRALRAVGALGWKAAGGRDVADVDEVESLGASDLVEAVPEAIQRVTASPSW